jgi:catechol 2,3-dioxygenase-like lactoylglutathione lyase family enzyme
LNFCILNQGAIDMLGYATVGTKNLETACAFYDALLAGIGGKQLMGLEHIKFYGIDGGGAMLAIASPYNGEPQACGNGNMIAIPGGSTAGADALYAKAMELGATDEGAPGQRLPFFYGAYVRDADGNKLCFFHMTAI